MCSLKMTKNWINGISLPVFDNLYFIFSHIVFSFLNFQLLAKKLNFIFVEYAWKLGYLRYCYV